MEMEKKKNTGASVRTRLKNKAKEKGVELQNLMGSFRQRAIGLPEIAK
jgi:hypothetical protein